MSKENPVIYMIVGEPSGDLLASRLMKAINGKTFNRASFFGLGGESMAEMGFTSLFDISELSIMGLFEVLPRIPLILRRIRQVVNDIKRKKPDVIVSVDSWSFAARVLKAVKKAKLDIPCVHYVAPQVWAWKKGRAKTMYRYIDHLLCLLPQEPPMFTKYRLKADFVGHPVIEGGAGSGLKNDFYQQHELSDDDLVMTVLPGSRKNEVSYLLPIFKETLTILKAKYPNLRPVMPVVRTVKNRVLKEVATWNDNIRPILTFGEKAKYDAFAASIVALAASGTVGLELVRAGLAHIITYKVSPLTAFLLRRLIKVKYVNLVNILAKREIIPEMLQEDCEPVKLASLLDQLMKDRQMREHQIAEASEVMKESLSNGDKRPSDIAADIVLSYVC